ncbi:PDZ domain-containing protein [Candidatus Wolfebacteria bacterium]|nr:PDZ domain-containing protein [Candidatus Wolfebacteria bacterium]
MKKTFAIIISLSFLINPFFINQSNSADLEIEKPQYIGSRNKPAMHNSESVIPVNNDLTAIKLFVEIAFMFERFYYKDITKMEFLEKVLDGGVSSIDRYSSYDGAAETKDFNKKIEGHFVGIGIEIGQKDIDGNSYLAIMSVFDDSPADKVGLKAGDLIIGVSPDGTKRGLISTMDMNIDTLIKNIKGEAGTKVLFRLKRSGKYFNILVIRDDIKVTIISSEMIKPKIGYLRIREFFGREFIEDIKLSLWAMTQSRAEVVIIDLRNNPGGFIKDALGLINLLRKDASAVLNPPLVYEKTKRGEESYTGSLDDAGKYKNFKLIILTNGGSASASELTTAYLKGYCGAVVVGKTTFGKGVGQYLLPLSNGGSLRVTSFEYFVGPNKIKVNHIGVKPDYEVEDLTNTKKDEQLDKALELANGMLSK